MSDSSLKFSISGLRGIAGVSLTDEVVHDYLAAFIEVTGAKKIVLGYDTRATGPAILEKVTAQLRDYGCEIIDIGIVATPTAQIMVRRMEADAGVCVTASHNPPEYNGLKFFDSQGLYLNEIKVSELSDRVKAKMFPQGGKELESMLTRIDTAGSVHLDSILEHIDQELIQKAALKVVMDPDGGAGTMMDPLLAKQLGLDALIIHGEPSAEFPRGTEPTIENLALLSDAVIKKGADIGFGQDPDADRLAIVDEHGVPIGEEYTLALAIDYWLSKTSGLPDRMIATNLSTSRMIDDIAKKHDVNLVRTKIGEMYVASALTEGDGIIGGEGNGGVIWPAVGFGRDSFSGMAIILEYLAVSGKKVSELVASLPKYEVVKMKKEVEQGTDISALYKRVQEVFKGEEIDITEGVKVVFPNGWLHVRASNTEPIVRYFAEAPTKEQAEGWVNKVL